MSACPCQEIEGSPPQVVRPGENIVHRFIVVLAYTDRIILINGDCRVPTILVYRMGWK
jgi:hypothetical protein